MNGCDQEVAALLRAEEALDEELDATVRVDAKGIVAASVRRKSSRRLPMPPMWAAAAVAASVTTALLLILPGRQEPRPEATWQPPAVASRTPVVSAPHHNVAVIQTGDPDITVFWFYKE